MSGAVPAKLSTYRKKRDVSRTNEPFGDEPRAEGTTYKGAFVVHQHDATRMHFDLRLEIGGVLASFAVPKGISLDPADKHLAVNTEDHPIARPGGSAEKGLDEGSELLWLFSDESESRSADCALRHSRTYCSSCYCYSRPYCCDCRP